MFPTIFEFSKEDIGNVTVLAKISNLVSTTTLKFEFTLVEVINIMKLNVQANDETASVDLDSGSVHIATFKELTFTESLQAGSHINVSIEFGDGEVDETTPSNFLDRSATFKHIYKAPGIYDISISASNVISNLNRAFLDSIYVYDEVNDVRFNVKNVIYDPELYPDANIFQNRSELFTLIFGVAATHE